MVLLFVDSMNPRRIEDGAIRESLGEGGYLLGLEIGMTSSKFQDRQVSCIGRQLDRLYQRILGPVFQ